MRGGDPKRLMVAASSPPPAAPRKEEKGVSLSHPPYYIPRQKLKKPSVGEREEEEGET